MAKTKVYAPEGHHFMVNNEGGFYLMKNPDSGYKAHTVNGEKSSLYILLEVKDYHVAPRSTAVRSRTYSSRPSTTRTARRAVSTTSTTVTRSTRSSGRSSGGGGYSGGGGGY